MKFFLSLFFFLCCLVGYPQGNSFPYGKIGRSQLLLNSYDKDTSANAVVLKEFGESYVSTIQEKGLIFNHHYIIKILKAGGLDEANVVIPIYKGGLKNQSLISIKASSYNLENNVIQETEVDSRTLYIENINKYWENNKITIPNVRVGSVIEVQYEISDPFFVSNFHPWLFQSHIPKVSSEYWATIPGNYLYNMTLKGYLELKKNESKILKECFDLGSQYKADCAQYIFSMENIPAFIEEEYMTAKSNFIAGVNFELSEIKQFDGRVDRVTKEWKDADGEVHSHRLLGVQLKKGKEIFQKVEPFLNGVTDPTLRAKRIYDFVNSWYIWNEYNGMFSEDGIKKAFEDKKGNAGDINLSLIAALRYAEFDVEPLLLSTRENGLPIDLHPVLTDFNYVVAKLNIGDKVYLLDATDRLMPFGMLPERCLNGKGRAFPDKKPSYWFDLKATEKDKNVSMLNLTVQPSGKIIGTIEFAHFGYDAVDKRREILSFDSPEKYVQALNKKWTSVTIEKSEITGVEDKESTIKEKFEVEIEGFDDMNNNNLFLNPFFTGKIGNNPFRLTERVFPVDFGSVPDITVILTLTYPANYELVSKPEKNVYSLPNSSAKFLFDVIEGENKLTMNFVLSINKPEFNSNEYRFLKELFNRVVQTQSTDLIFQRKK